MSHRQARRITHELTPGEQARLEQERELIENELPELKARDQMRKEAREEATPSDQLRRAVHASDFSLTQIAACAGITPILLDDFLTGERTLCLDVMDRLGNALGCELQR